MQVKIKKLHPDAVIPKYAKNSDAGLDLTAVSQDIDYDYSNIVYKTGLAIEIPEGHVGLLYPRSSITKTDMMLGNSVGIIDAGYRGELILKFKLQMSSNDKAVLYEVGERVGQLVIIPYPKIELVEAEELSSTERGNGGFGSSGA